MAETEMSLNNGLSAEHEAEIDQLMIDIIRLGERLRRLDRHRSISLAATKLDEARHWLRDRLVSAA